MLPERAARDGRGGGAVAATPDAAELLREALDAAPVLEQPPGWSLRHALVALHRAEHADEALQVLLRYARDFVEAAAVLAVSSKGVEGLDAVGWPEARSRCRSLHLAASTVGLFRAPLTTAGPHLGPVPRDEGSAALLAALGRPWPAAALLSPIVTGGRIVCLLYADNGEAPVSPRRIGDLLLACGAAGAALARTLGRAKRLRAVAPAARRGGDTGWCVHEPARAPERSSERGSEPAA